MNRPGNCYIGRRLVDGVKTLFARCSCGQEYEGKGAGGLLDEHLSDCPDLPDYIAPSEATEAWAALHYGDQTMTLDEWKARR